MREARMTSPLFTAFTFNRLTWPSRWIMPAIALCLASCGATATDDVRADASSLVAFADSFDRAQLEKDGAALGHMVADDLVFITGEGERQGKEEFIAGWTAPDDNFEPITLVDRVVLPLGADAGVVSAETVLNGRSGGRPFSSKFRFSDTFVREDGEWRAIHIQVSRIPE
jgi:ketosteroid isomerase-like protein